MSFLKVIRADGQTEQRQIAEMKARAADTAADIDSYSVIKLFHLFLPIVRSRRAA